MSKRKRKGSVVCEGQRKVKWLTFVGNGIMNNKELDGMIHNSNESVLMPSVFHCSSSSIITICQLREDERNPSSPVILIDLFFSKVLTGAENVSKATKLFLGLFCTFVRFDRQRPMTLSTHPETNLCVEYEKWSSTIIDRCRSFLVNSVAVRNVLTNGVFVSNGW